MKIAKTYRLNPVVLQKLEEIQNYYANDLLQRPGDYRTPTATAVIEFLIIKEHAATLLKEEN